jgi:ribonuclease PH
MSDPKAPNSLSRSDGRNVNQLRKIEFQNNIAPHATGSTLISWGNTQVICTATIEPDVPRWMKEQKVEGGWLTAEYSMLPYSTHRRKSRDINRGKIDGRSQEIQRLIGRSLRSAVNLKKLGQKTVWLDCDVLQADGGTRTAAITGSYVALSLAIQRLQADRKLAQNPIEEPVAAVSVGVVDSIPMLDLCYVEDVKADVDMNIVMTASGKYIEVQGTGEEATFSREELNQLLDLASEGVTELAQLQQSALEKA